MSQPKKRIAKFVGGPADGMTHEREFYANYSFKYMPPGPDEVLYVRSGAKDEEGRELWIVDASDKE